jgi:chromosome transmission fidelity protein 1
MSPFDDYKTHLFPNHPADKITTLSCGHVIPKENLLGWVLASIKPTPSGNAGAVQQQEGFEFSFQRRNDPAMIKQLGLVLLNLCTVVPDGVVAFFPSYAYLDQVVEAWQKGESSGAAGQQQQQLSIWDRLAAKKAVFREERGVDTDALLQAYADAILAPGTSNPSSTRIGAAAGSGPRKPGGALLLSVVGGKLSEGINFADRLGRCVVVVGLPYPNAHSPEWKARLEYVETAELERMEKTQALLADGGGTEDASSTMGNARDPSHGQDEKRQQTTQSITGSGTTSAGPLAQPARNPQARAKARQAAQSFYENACMRAVNQSIGRAIRHRADYAAVVLIDRRYALPRVRDKLPGWIRAGMVEGSESKGLAGLMGGLSGFFKGRNTV